MIFIAALFNLVGPDILALVFYVGLPLAASQFLGERHLRLRPRDRPFLWGYYNAGMAFCTPFLIASVAWDNLLVAAVLFFGTACVFVPLGILVLNRNRWGFLILTVATLNPLFWVINGIYLRNRWEEMGSAEAELPVPPAPVSVSRITTTKTAPPPRKPAPPGVAQVPTMITMSDVVPAPTKAAPPGAAGMATGTAVPLPPPVASPAKFKFACPHCGQRISVTAEDVGTTANCPSCNEGLTVPAPEG